ncbi:MAG TPA: TraR/DksA C4-type zinc finger protein [Methylomusa anaerophila]|uniref:General stress protein 16O n=1 Tax=Methylomusa anaerophila TaxID=1930071 RepID=A0A348AMP9_9FIRM|nr:TraR/DksA C4-type zinc finger protein [Methylomusa anaerophila]BBB92347.1 general stress protein 16O [Methylomusa anaerophila]HML90014.1 TraR/DksA C4-type zinc finger protein [Methylomusa anaerophila]
MQYTQHLPPAVLQRFKNALIKEKDRLTQVISRLEETGIGDTMSDSVGELSMYDNHPADLGDVVFERSKDVALRDNEHILLEQVEAALDRIHAGSYGICEKCGRKIDIERLEALPWAVRCIECQKDRNVIDATPRPLEEGVLAPPFHRTFLDTADINFVGFDGEDALQAVLKWGSSDSPQDIPGSYNYKAAWPNSNEHQGIVDLADAIPSNAANTRNPTDKRYKETNNN